MQAAFIIPKGKVTHVNFAQAARVRAIDRAWGNLRAISAGCAPEATVPASGIWLELAVCISPARPAGTAEVIRAFGPAAAQEGPCQALQTAKRRAALESLL